MDTQLMTAQRTRMIATRFLAVFILCVGAGQSAHAWEWQHFDYGGEIKCMTASGGQVWIGGDAGAMQYDLDTGRFLRLTRHVNTLGDDIALCGSIVRAIAVDPKGRTWFACWEKTKRGLTGMGITMMGPVGFWHFTAKDGLPSNDVYALEVDPQGRVWAGTEAGVVLLDEGTWKVYTTEDGLYRNDAMDITLDGNGRVWCGFWRGVNAYYDDHWYTWERKRIDYVTSIVAGPENRVYCATKGGLAVYDGERWEMARIRGDLRKRVISDMAIDMDGNVWCAWGGMDKGISVYNGDGWARITRRNTQGGLARNRARTVAADRHNRIWVGDRDGKISVMVPDGAPEVFDGTLIQTTSAPRPIRARRYSGARPPKYKAPTIGGFLFAALDRRYSIMPALHWAAPTDSSALRSREDNLPPGLLQTESIAVQGFADLEWEPSLDEPEFLRGLDEPVRYAQAAGGAAASAQIKVAAPPELEQSTADAPYETSESQLDLSVMIGGTLKLAKVEVNGFKADLPEGMEFSGQFMYQYSAKVLLKDIDQIHIEVFDEKDNSIAFRDIPIKVTGPSAEENQPNLFFLYPEGISEEKVMASRGGGAPIEVQMTTANKGNVRGVVQDDTGIKSLTVNGAEVQYIVDAPPSRLEEAGLSGQKNVKYFEHGFELDEGTNEIRLQAFDLFDNVAEITLDLRLQEFLRDSDLYGTSYAMIVGINKYQNWRPLENAVHDAQGIKSMLMGTFEFPEDQIFEVFDADATQAGISGAFKQVAKATEDSRVIIFYAGHGQTVSTRGGKKGYLIPVDGAPPSARKPTLEELDTWISMVKIRDEVGLFDAKHILMIFDACYSGLMAAKRSSGFGDLLSQESASAEFIRLSQMPAVEVITAGNANEEVWDGGRDGHSIFTGALLDGLLGGKADTLADGVVTSQELGFYIWKEVSTTTGQKQNPAYAKLPGYETEEGLVLFPIGGKG